MDSVVIFLARDLFVSVIIVGLIAYFSIPRSKRLEFIIALIVAGVVAFTLAKMAGWLYFNPRPFVIDNIKPLIPHGADNGFPSEHTVLVMTLSALVYFYRRQLAIVAFVLTLLVGAGRVWAHIHSWIDILGGLAIGAIAGYIGYKLSVQMLNRDRERSRFSAKQPEDRR